MIRPCAVAAVSAVLCAGATAAPGAVNASGGSGPSTATQVNDALTGGSLFWVVSSSREDVAHDPAAGPWQLTLKNDDGGDFTVDDSPTGAAVSGGRILNQLKVTGTQAWTGWTMRLSDANFIWSSTVEADTDFTNAFSIRRPVSTSPSTAPTSS